METSGWKEILAILLTIAGTLGGTILGWWLNKKSSQKEKEPRLCYSLVKIQNDKDLIPLNQRTKYSESGFGVKIYNLGLTPVIINEFELYYKNDIVTDGLVVDKTIMPYENTVYELSQQEYDNICSHCRNDGMKKCDIFADDESEKKNAGMLDVEFLYMELEMQNSVYSSLTGKSRQ